MNLLDLCPDIHYLINQEIKNTKSFYLKKHKDNFKKVLEDIDNSNYQLYNTDLELLIETPILFAYYLDDCGWWIEDIIADITGRNWITDYFDFRNSPNIIIPDYQL
tara:strand:+ start:3416 stop:3733 length:318 start_codon:yes stop_codon:yes gene_type:complete